MAKSKEKNNAILLRKKGSSIKEIAKILDVSTSSVSLWCWDVFLTDEIQKLIVDKGRKLSLIGSILAGQRKKEETNKKKENIHKKAVKEIGKLTRRDVLIAGVALYWGEGFKKDHLVGLATTDVGIAKFYIKWLRVCFNISHDRLILRLTINEERIKDINMVSNFWCKELGIDKSQFSKPYIQKTKWKKIYTNPNTYTGVLRIKVRRSIDILRRIEGMINGLRINA